MFGLLIKEKKKKNETDFQGMSYPFQKNLVITINILNLNEEIGKGI